MEKIKSIRIEAEESGQGVYKHGILGHQNAGKKCLTSLQDVQHRIPCARPHCYGGGYDFHFIVQQMVDNYETEGEGSLFCKGHEASPKGVKKYKKCMNALDYKISIIYDEDSSDPK